MYSGHLLLYFLNIFYLLYISLMNCQCMLACQCIVYICTDKAIIDRSVNWLCMLIIRLTAAKRESISISKMNAWEASRHLCSSKQINKSTIVLSDALMVKQMLRWCMPAVSSRALLNELYAKVQQFILNLKILKTIYAHKEVLLLITR